MPTALSTDLYELTMAAAYHAHGVEWPATFDLFARSLPPHRGCLVAAGLEQALEHLESLRFTSAEIAYLRATPALAGAPESFFEAFLPSLRFTGDVWAVDEGTPVFAGEPLLSVTAPAAEAQLVETALLATVGFQTSIASKAARVVAAARGRSVVEFGGRRAHGTEAATYAARAAFIGGCAATSNVDAGFRFGIPVSGTMAHSWVMMHDDEMVAFRRWHALYGDRAVLLLDTYDTLGAARRVAASDLAPAAVRLDSGDLLALSLEVRRILDGGGKPQTRILASGDLDEFRVADLVAAGAPIDGFGVGTALSTSLDAPALPCVYKLAEVWGATGARPTMKLSAGKQTWPGRKQVWRVGSGPRAVRDVIGTQDEAGPGGAEPLLRRVMRAGQRLESPVALETRQRAAAARLAQLPPELLAPEPATDYPVVESPALLALADRVRHQIG